MDSLYNCLFLFCALPPANCKLSKLCNFLLYFVNIGTFSAKIVIIVTATWIWTWITLQFVILPFLQYIVPIAITSKLTSLQRSWVVMPPTDITPNIDMGPFELSYSSMAYNKIPVSEYRSKNTGLTVVLAEVEGPVVNGFFCVGMCK